MMNPVMATCQIINCSRPGEEPQDLFNTPEDLRLWEPSLVDSKGGWRGRLG